MSARQQIKPGRLWSLWEIMLKKAAWEFGRALSDLRLMEIAAGAPARMNMPLHPDQDRDYRVRMQDVLGNMKRVCILSDLDDDIGPELDRFQAALQTEPLDKVAQRCDHLRNRIQDELQNEHYFQVDRREVRFYDQDLLFGGRVGLKFKAAASDIKNAGNCLALHQPDACVFHLMRAMEVAVQRLSKRLGIAIGRQTTWRVMTGNMDDKIKVMPTGTDRQREKKHAWEAARANLHQVGSVWRNSTMHPATTYTQSQANDIFQAVRVFMRALAEL